MTSHVLTDPNAPGSAVYPALPAWETLSAALTAEVPALADRDDLLVTIAPGAGCGSPACFFPARALIEVDGTHLGGIDPATLRPDIVSDRARYAPTWGALTHECAHAQHTRWTPPPEADPQAVAAALLLEEPRIEGAQVRRRPDDRHWLRACVKAIVTGGMDVEDPAFATKMTERDAAKAAALFLARADGGILAPAEVAPVRRAVRAVLGPKKLAALRSLWRAALGVSDDDADTMIELGRRWCAIIEPDGDTAHADPEPGPTDGGTPSPLAESIGKAFDNIARAVAGEPLPIDPVCVAAQAKSDADAANKVAQDVATAVFVDDGFHDGDTETAGTRRPTARERSAARVLARSLNIAGIRERVATKHSSTVPPGRPRMRAVLTREAQRAAGAIPTAEPFTRTIRTVVPSPPLRLGIACDVSASMNDFAGPVASAAWILANAAAHAPVPAETATVIFGSHVRPITYPGTAPTSITEFAANDTFEAVDVAINALDGALGLNRPGAARLLVIVSDGLFRDKPRSNGQKLLDRLRANGCAVLWIAPDTHYHTPMRGASVHVMSDPAAAAQAIGRAATEALRSAR